MFNIALIAPEIPQNTGNIGRICVNNDCILHLVRPFGFSLDEKYLKRAGLDYWKYLKLREHNGIEQFFKFIEDTDAYIFTTHAKKYIWDCPFKASSFLIFGNESSGLPEIFHKKLANNSYKIPMIGKNSRSMNLANAVSVVVYEGIRKKFIS